MGSEQFAEGGDRIIFVTAGYLPEGTYVVSQYAAMRVNHEALQQLATSGQEITTESLGAARKDLLGTEYQDRIPEPIHTDINAVSEKFKAD